ncbi:hypothetical protein Taro_009171 [Colocasia esculenta]|uniref:11-beta-hydroxysteroid dehydrogenase-like 5 n=1 Tax=Colocasia esculenta TaxID=4460 RepID=A0A843TVN8_COLES|nr:hypothetical protein [Colocasia esculenta]
MDLINSLLNFVVPPASLVMLAFAWPTLCFLHACEWLFRTFYRENMDDKVVVITGASSGIGEQIAYEYARRRANLVLVARRENRLWGIRENARLLGAKHVLVMAADVVKEDDCRRFISDTFANDFRSVTFDDRGPCVYVTVDHLVNAASLGHSFFFEEATDTSVFPHLMDINFWGNVYPTYVSLPYLRRSRGRIVVNASVESWLPMPKMSLYAAAKAAVINFYETLRFEVKEEVGITISTHGWIGSDMSRGRFMLEEGAEMQWKEEREGRYASANISLLVYVMRCTGNLTTQVPLTGGHVEEFAKSIVAGACRGDAYVKFPSWYDIFLLYRVFAPDVLGWTFRLLFSTQGTKRISMVDIGRPASEAGTPRRTLPAAPTVFPPGAPQQQQQLQKVE